MNVYAVVGPWRGGTSLVTAILNALGVFVGSEFVDAKTEYTTFEDIRLQKACLGCFDERLGRWCYYGSREDRVQLLRNWIDWAYPEARSLGYCALGGKHPVMCKLVDELDEAWSTTRGLNLVFVSVIRSREDIHRSWTRPRGAGLSHWWPRWDREYVVDDLIRSRDLALATRRHIQLDFNALRKDPTHTISLLANACNLPLSQVASAAALVNPGQSSAQ